MSKVKEVLEQWDLVGDFAIELLEAVQAELEEVAFERGIDRQKVLIKLQSLIDEIK